MGDPESSLFTSYRERRLFCVFEERERERGTATERERETERGERERGRESF